ncbi:MULTISPECIES: hypothetical protein [unclassified Hydrogenobaculum]|uniref:hypothetical protein n=1 Tax=unclassified Hydrogenobaculum TaxID=2622382 RepID=UPI0001C50A9D|nr:MULTISPECIES: hypothetical protein [unclassified Hydrogenobaculum]AEF19908.1 hypothetical protein Hyd3684_1531 [Hydrogenobaculum sp. 3684]AEG47194.1 hypothetical protein HydSHO_1534 [Hydrogenobaculum sp. SHO]AGG15842.1 hypothetical protein HydHO_1536 [Hydrogenobaculum sp. HO]AGH94142.1 hypothetical protein HydSN_1579 [Hydrogenobaculum sp. SN]
MRKIKSTALLGAFVAVASVGAISHEAHGTKVTSIVNTIAKEYLPGNVSLPTPYITPSVNYPSNASVTLILSGASFVNGDYYAILGAGSSTLCTTQESYSGLNSLTLSNCSLTANASYTIVGGGLSTYANNTSFTVYGSQGTSSIVLSYSSDVGNDTPSSVTLAQVQQQLTVTPANAGTAIIDPSSLSTFVSGSYVYDYNTAYNTMTISSSTGFSTSISSDTLNVVFNGIPSSVSTIYTYFSGATSSTSDTASSNYTQGTGSATVSLTLPSNGAVFSSPYSDTAIFHFSNSGNIQPGTIYISSIASTSSNSYSYFSGSQNFLTFAFGGTQIYVPDALAPYDGNAIQSGYITISMPSSASIASISVLNNPSASCPTNGILTSTSTPNVYYINLATLASLCTGLTPTAWQSGVPLVINIAGSNATPNNITADAYATFNGMLKRIPVNVVYSAIINYLGFFSY